jgi:hypothetical protein
MIEWKCKEVSCQFQIEIMKHAETIPGQSFNIMIEDKSSIINFVVYALHQLS